MTDEEQRIAIAEACGWHAEDSGNKYSDLVFNPQGNSAKRWIDRGHLSEHWIDTWKTGTALPDYLNDLNAIHAAVMSLPDTDNDGSRHHYRLALMEVCGASSAIDATAAQRAEAFLRTISKWKQ